MSDGLGARRQPASTKQAQVSHAKSQSRQPSSAATPSMAQYLEIKTANPDSLLWCRMGDFYELFFEDAVAASKALSIVLTKRGKHQGQDIPMCGVPVHRADEYLQRLIKAGYRVAVCEQLEDPAEARKRGSKAIVRRDVVRLVTPGTLTEDALLDARQRNFLTAVFSAASSGKGRGAGKDGAIALASVDISTGETEIGRIKPVDLPGELVRLSPSEILVIDSQRDEPDLAGALDQSRSSVTEVPRAYFDSREGARQLKDALGVSDLSAFGGFDRSELAAAGAVLTYIDLTQMGQKPLLRAPQRRTGQGGMIIDAATRSSLELVKSASGNANATLLSAIDRTVTGAGARELYARLTSPLADAAAINARLDVVSFFVDQVRLRDDVRGQFRQSPDLARALPRLAFGRGDPRDLAAIRDALQVAAGVADRFETVEDLAGLPPLLRDIVDGIGLARGSLQALLTSALADDLPVHRRDGGFIRTGLHAELDDARALRDDSRTVIAKLESQYGEQSGVKSLKIRHNNILGYFIEVTQANAKPLLEEPLNATFRHRQTMANAVRFTTEELIDIEGRIAAASERAIGLEQQMFSDLVQKIDEDDAMLVQVAEALAKLDVFVSLAELAVEQELVRPHVDDSLMFDIQGGRHPVVQQALARDDGKTFIANDCRLSGSDHGRHEEEKGARLWLVTGPNMAGKSTFLRQNALLAVMAQMGSFVPVQLAHIGVVDRLFSRVGASDDLARGRSTFMVEMVETAAILNQATDRSLVILDEIGRGTATFDGLSIAWATVEFLHDVTKCRALFATHYHELTVLARRLEQVANVTMAVSEWHDQIVFLHEVRAGAADRSYGIQVAKLAGLPENVVARAQDVLERLEKADGKTPHVPDIIDNLPLFNAHRARPQKAPEVDPVVAAVEALRPDDLTPRDALETLYSLKDMLKQRDQSEN